MIVRNRKGTTWPTPEQELLLRAALMPDTQAIDAWAEWEARGTIDRLDVGSQRLLPLVYRNLSALRVEDPLIGRLKLHYHRIWYENQRAFHHMAAVLRSFHRVGIRTLVLKGGALVLLHYKDHGLRPMSDFDVLVPTHDALRAIDVIAMSGWAPKTKLPLPESLTWVAHGMGFKNAGASHDLDLHWHVFDECCRPDGDQDFWRDAVTARLHDVETLALNPTDQLLHVCVHGIKWDPSPAIRWVADAMTVLRSAEFEIDWQRLVAQTEKRRLGLWLSDAMSYLRETLDAPIPVSVLERLRAMPASKRERIEYRYKSRSFQERPLGYLPILWFNYARLAESGGSTPTLTGFVKYLQGWWGAKSFWALPLYGLMALAQRVWAIVRRRWGQAAARFSRN
jgi:hypothetical protein